MIDASTTRVIIAVVAGTLALLLMALFGVSFIFYYHQKRRENRQEKQMLAQAFERELLQTQVETQNHTLQQIAQELHDNIGQLLTVMVMRLNSLEDEIDVPEMQEEVQQTRALVRKVIGDVRALSKSLDYDNVQQFGLIPCLHIEVDRIQRIGRVQAQLMTTGDSYSLGSQTETVLLRMVQESINNALKHAHAQRLTVSADYKPDQFILTIADDGRGFDVDEAYTRELHQAGSGLNNLKRRTSVLGGIFTIESRLGGGTRVQIQLPRNQAG